MPQSMLEELQGGLAIEDLGVKVGGTEAGKFSGMFDRELPVGVALGVQAASTRLALRTDIAPKEIAAADLVVSQEETAAEAAEAGTGQPAKKNFNPPSRSR